MSACLLPDWRLGWSTTMNPLFFLRQATPCPTPSISGTDMSAFEAHDLSSE